MQRSAQTSFQRNSTLINQILQWVLFAYQAIAVVIFLLSMYLSVRWFQQPFIGAFYEHTLVFNGTGPGEPSPEWALFGQVVVGDQLTAINGESVSSSEQIHSILNDRVPGENVIVTVHSEAGDRDLNVTLHEFPSSSRTTYFIVPSILSLIFLIASWWIFGLRRNEPAGRAFSLFTSSLAIITGAYFNLITTHEFTVVWVFGCALAGGALFDLGLSFPLEPRAVINRPYLRWVGIVIGIVLALINFTTLFNFDQPTAYIPSWQYIYAFIALGIIFYIGTNLYQAFFAQSPVVKTQSRAILLGTLLAFVPVGIWLGLGAIQPLNFSPYLFLPLAFFPLTIGYTILRFRFLRTDDFVRRGLMYFFLTAFVMGGYALIVTGIGLLINTSTDVLTNNPYLVGGSMLLLALLLEPFRVRLQTIVDNTFFRGERALAEKLETFSHSLTTALDLNSISTILREQIASTLTPSRIHIYTYDSLNDFFSALPGEDRRPTSDIRFTTTSPFVRYFENEHLPLYLDTAAALPPALQSEQSRLALLGARLFVVLPGKKRINGWLALGPRLSGQPYTPRDLRFLENICDQASVAIERMQTVAHLERQIQEMNALTRVSQGVNVTLTFDDVLELIYAQTAQIIPTSHFHITLYNEPSDYYYYGFCVENNERIPDRENLPFPVNAGLSPEVISKSRQIMTQDYIHECQARSLTPILENVFAWMGVPLNAGAKSIGALSIGSRDGATAYTRGQLELLQAIADQTAGAIVKARLLEETQQRAHQLSTLNEINRQLTSTLELSPLLQNILENAVGILNCEAGSLFLVDEQTKELVFKVTVGPVAANLIGQRLPPGTGIVGRAVQSRGPVIENEEHRSASRFKGVDQQTGFVSRSLMAVPLQVKDRVIGVVEVINRRDGLPFVSGDQDLLTAFAGQAAVAIENARLYTLTDQELAARVEELSVMQRIDRELNASLEMDRAMRITLEWALRQSDAEAGLIGMLEEGKLRVMAHQGLDDRMANLPDQTMKIEIPAMTLSIENGQPQSQSVTTSNEKLLANAHTQMIIPIRRETTVIGLLHLESTSDSQVDIGFLTRLTDHAAIAISNAQLFGEVQRANTAKSDFVSFVAHELKNPMTSIKGYTELIAGGAVGQINEMQTNFLHTIRSNVERMSTLVSDLNDNSKIEAGRLRLEYKATNAPDLVDEVSRSLKRQIEDKKQTLETALPEKISLMWADRIRVSQVLVNLVSNAYKYTPEGGAIQIGVEETTNHWDPEGAVRVVHFWVKDNGIGMTIEDQQKMFQKFFRSDDPKAREAPGTGLGLNITKSLVEMQGGKIWFESEYRKGTIFHFTIPVAEE
ncbi:MAG: GAF domain-containing protein [Anaerolineales bacterium]|uniref:GAF domain-containing protein n=1 Tax=Candidatus Villigracilis affinis TaxID=3140682 RepID=UPI002A1C6687|nr:GAF domain-containing protein [Anaerolineales bacterium]MBL0345586.1 GAF domain-containing protein [Anaerolineales bacterium]